MHIHKENLALHYLASGANYSTECHTQPLPSASPLLSSPPPLFCSAWPPHVLSSPSIFFCFCFFPRQRASCSVKRYLPTILSACLPLLSLHTLPCHVLVLCFMVHHIISCRVLPSRPHPLCSLLLHDVT